MQIKTKNIFKDIRQNKYFQLLPDLKEERVQKFTTLILTLVALSFFGLFAISPTVSTIAKLQKELADNKYVDQQLTTKINNLSVLQSKYVTVQNDLPVVLSAIPRNPEVPTLTAQVHAAVLENGLTPISFQTFQVAADASGPNPERYTSFLFGLSANGNFESVKNFITSIINMDRIVSIDTIFISKGEGDDTLKLNFKGEAYSKK